MANQRGTVRRPRLTGIPGVRAPKGYGVVEVAIKEAGLPEVRNPVSLEPAGDPPEDFPGTRPEWAIYWALLQKGFQEGVDFIFQARTAGVEGGYYSTLDFLLPEFHLALEIQGTFWHFGVGYETIENDVLRIALFAEHGFTVVPIPEELALQDPIGQVDDALRQV